MDPLDRLSGHQKVGLFFSGGKDSLVCVYLLREFLETITIYHNDTGDQLPEVRDQVAAVQAFAPHFVRIETDVGGWIAQHGIPTDLLPYSAHFVGHLVGDTATKLISRYDCCLANLMIPLWVRAKEDGCTMVIRGIKRVDMPKLPAQDGEVFDGVELYYPIQEWSDAQVVNYLHACGVKLSRIYEHMDHMVDCATCSAWWTEKRGAYLKQFHPEKFRQYDARLQTIINEIAKPLAELRREAGVA